MKIADQKSQYKVTSGITHSCRYHTVFAVKYRRKVLVGKIAERLKEIIVEGQTKGEYVILELEVMSDHTHLLLEVNPKIGVYSTICGIKDKTGGLLRNEFAELKSKIPCLWTRSSFISSVGSLDTQDIHSYLEGQKHV